MSYWKNKWRLSAKTTWTTECGQESSKLFETMIPPTNGDRTDIITDCGKYYFGKTPKEFSKNRMSKEEYLDKIMPILSFEDEKERKEFMKARKKALKEMTWTPKKNNEEIAIVIEIKKGEITLKGK